MKYVGIDLHKKIIVLCVMGKDRKVIERKTFSCCEFESIRKYFTKLKKFQAVVEATASYEWLADILQPLAVERH